MTSHSQDVHHLDSRMSSSSLTVAWTYHSSKKTRLCIPSVELGWPTSLKLIIGSMGKYPVFQLYNSYILRNTGGTGTAGCLPQFDVFSVRLLYFNWRTCFIYIMQYVLCCLLFFYLCYLKSYNILFVYCIIRHLCMHFYFNIFFYLCTKNKLFITFNSKTKLEEPLTTEDSVELPGPEGPPISRIPALLPEQEKRSKDNINLNYVNIKFYFLLLHIGK